MIKEEKAKKNEFKNFTERERFLCDYASEIMMNAYHELRSPGSQKGVLTQEELLGNVSTALQTLESEARGMKKRKQMKCMFWLVRRM